MGDKQTGQAAALARSVIEPPPLSSYPTFDSNILWFVGQAADEFIPWGQRPKARDRQLREFLTTESMFAGALGIICARNSAFSWSVRGSPRTASKMHDILENSNFGAGWQDLITKISIDLYTQDTGAFIETVREGDTPDSPLIMLNHLDAYRCWHTGNPDKPVIYQDRKGGFHLLNWWNVIPLSEMPTPIEGLYGLQYCSLTRLLLACQIMKNISIYKREKTGGRHNRALHFVSGVTSQQITDAVERYKSMVDAQGLQRYVNPMIIGSIDPQANVSATTLELSAFPDSWNEEEAFKQYIVQIAMAFLEDYQTFAPLPGGNLGTSTQSRVLHMKSRGKGPALFMKMITHALNFKVMPSNCKFAFEEKDLDADEINSTIGKLRAEERQIRIQSGELLPEEARQLAVDSGDLPLELFQRGGGTDITPNVSTGDEAKLEQDMGQPSQTIPTGELLESSQKEVKHKILTALDELIAVPELWS